MLSPGEIMLTGLLAATHRMHPDELLDVVRLHAAVIGLRDVDLYLVDLEQRTLDAIPAADQEPGPSFGIDESTPGRCFRIEELVLCPGEHDGTDRPVATRVWLPLLDGAERIGVMGTTVTGSPDELLLARCKALVTIVAELVVTKSPYGDGLTAVRRNRPMSLPGEMRWENLLPLTWTSERVAISGQLEPAYEVAGDTFDYTVRGAFLDFAVFDAVGHDLQAARIADLVVLTYRNARRAGGDLEDFYRAVDDSLRLHVGSAAFSTGHLGRLNMDSGELSWINAGHPPPMLLRKGTDVFDLASDPSMPMGLGGAPGEPSTVQLEPDDRLLFFTDGMTESRSRGGEQFGRDRLAELFTETAEEGLTHPETTRRLTHAVLRHQAGGLQDDATIVLIVWRGPPGSEQEAAV